MTQGRQLEASWDLVLLAENSQRESETRGQMAKIHEQRRPRWWAAKGREDYAVDIDALRQEVLMAFEQELSLRKIVLSMNPTTKTYGGSMSESVEKAWSVEMYSKYNSIQQISN